jgi:hypothetical protein
MGECRDQQVAVVGDPLLLFGRERDGHVERTPDTQDPPVTRL